MMGEQSGGVPAGPDAQTGAYGCSVRAYNVSVFFLRDEPGWGISPRTSYPVLSEVGRKKS